MEKPIKLCGENCKQSSRRKFIKNSFFTAGAITLGGLGIHGLANTTQRRSAVDATSGGTVRAENAYTPKYLALAKSGELERRERALWAKMESCDLCPRKCGVNRMAGRKGLCSSDHTLRVASAEISLAEERVTVGTRGTGSIFMSNCNLLCVFCQNWQINHRGDGVEITHEQLADVMIELQRRGVHNIGIVTPTHAVPHLVTSLRLAIDKGLNIPFLYNTGGYDSLEVIELFDGIADMYIPDFKFQDCAVAAPFIRNAPDYTLHAAAAIKEMHRQVGKCEIVNGVMNTGMIIRHLVLPENLGGADRLVRWIVDELGADTHVNIMRQYRPEFRARYHPPLDRRITALEFEQAMRWAVDAGLRNFH